MIQAAIALTIVFVAAGWLASHFICGRASGGAQCGGGACSCGDGKSTLASPKRHPGAGACAGCASAAAKRT
jgi:hypothetical protein